MKLRLGNGALENEESFAKLARYGYDCAEFRMMDIKDSLYTCSEEEMIERLKKVKSYADKYNIAIHQMHGPWIDGFAHFNKQDLKKRLEERKRSIRACTYLDCKYWVIHPIFPNGVNDIAEGTADDTYKQNFEFYSELLETARECDVTICYENMPYLGYSLSQVDAVKRLIDDINDEHFKVCLDTGHVNCFKTYSLGEAVRLLGKDLKVLHVHDDKYSSDLHLFPYFGTADWDGFYEALVDIGFDGVLNLETAPPKKLDEKIWDEMSFLLVKIAKKVLHEEY